MQSGVRHGDVVEIWKVGHAIHIVMEQPPLIQSLAQMEGAFRGTFLELPTGKGVDKTNGKWRKQLKQRNCHHQKMIGWKPCDYYKEFELSKWQHNEIYGFHSNAHPIQGRLPTLHLKV